MRRKQIPANCPDHGHPQHVTPRNYALLQIYRVIQEAQGGLNATVLYYCCQDYHLDFFDVYQQLKQLDDILRERNQTIQDGGQTQDITPSLP